MKFFNVYCVCEYQGQALLFSNYRVFSKFVTSSIQSGDAATSCVLNLRCSDETIPFVRHCGRLKCNPFSLRDCSIQSISIGSKRNADSQCYQHETDDFVFSSLEVKWYECEAGGSSCSMSPIAFNFAADRRDISSVCFSHSFYFVGLTSKKNGGHVNDNDGLLEVLISGLLDGTAESFSAFIASESVGTIINDIQPFFIGFFLHGKFATALNIGYQKQMLCSVAPLVVYLSQSQSGIKNAEWSFTLNDSTPVLFHIQKQGFVVHANDDNVSTCMSTNGFDVFFKPGMNSVIAVDTITLRDIRVSRVYGKNMDTTCCGKVPCLQVHMRRFDFQDCFPSFSSSNLALLEKSDIFTYITDGNCFVHVIYILTHSEFRDLPAKQKTFYLNALTFIVSRTGMLFADWDYKNSFFAAKPKRTFMLHELKDVRAQHHAADLKRFYGFKSCESASPDFNFFARLIQSHHCCLKGKQDFSNAYKLFSFKKGFPSAPAIRNVQLYNVEQFASFRSSVLLLPTLEFYNNSCWMETAVNCLVSIPVSFIRMYASFSSVEILCFRSLIETMCIYGSLCQVSIFDCIRCGVFPTMGKSQVAPAVLGSLGYGSIFENDDDMKWGQIGSSIDALKTFLIALSIDIGYAPYNPDELPSPYYDSIKLVGFFSDVLIVDFHPDGLQPSTEREIVENSVNGYCVAVVFGNLAHNFAVTKSVGGIWTVKDALVSEFSSYPSFGQALARSRGLHPELYHVQYAVYVKL